MLFFLAEKTGTENASRGQMNLFFCIPEFDNYLAHDAWLANIINLLANVYEARCDGVHMSGTGLKSDLAGRRNS